MRREPTVAGTSALVLPLTAVGADDLAVAGGKAANLGELLQAGFTVPDGFVVTTSLYREALRTLGPTGTELADPATLRAALGTVELSPRSASAITDAYAALGGGAVAVRSSATVEDQPGAASAGQQETSLNVVGPGAVLDAVRRCWASLWSDRAVAYRARSTRSTPDGGTPEIAVLVQRLVPAEVAGVLFTADPVTGARDQVVVEASPGLGEAVVAGLVTPEHLVVDRSGRVRERRPGRSEVVVRPAATGGVVHEGPGTGDTALPVTVATGLARTGRAVAAHLGPPQDIEWAYAAGTTWVLQARPMTALPPAPLRLGRLRRTAGAISAELLPERPHPLDLTAWTVPGWFRILARMADEVAGLDIDPSRMFVLTDGVVSELVPPDPRPTRRTPGALLRQPGRARRHDPARWTSDPRFGAWETRLDEVAARDPAAATWSDLLTVPDEVLALLDQFVDLRVDYLPGAALALVRLRLLLVVLGLPGEFWPLLEGQASRTRAANDALDDLADQVRATPGWRELFASSDDGALVAAVWGKEPYAPLRAALRRWLDAYGHRETTSAALVSAPTWADDPALLLGTLRGLVSRSGVVRRGAGPPQDPASGSAEQRVRQLLRVRLTGTGPLLGGTTRAARSALVFREDSHFHVLRARPVLRAALREAGRRLAAAGVLRQPDEVFHLTLAELRGLDPPDRLAPEDVHRLQDLVRRRAARRAELGAAPLVSPATLFHLRRPGADALVSGTPGGGGRAEGPVRVVRRPEDFGRLRPGEVLVCPYTNPAWTPLFALAAAVVADSGSFGSHAAIVAREYGLPAVLGTGNGTRLLVDGQVVLVDGDRGEVVPPLAAPTTPRRRRR